MNTRLRQHLRALVAAIVPLAAIPTGRTHAQTTDPATWRTILTAPAVHSPFGLAIDLRGNPRAPKWAYTADTATGRVVKFGTGGHPLGSWPYGAAGNRASVAVGGSGNVFVADQASGAITKFSPTSRRLARWSGFSDPAAIAVDARGHLFVAETGAHRVDELSSGGVVLRSWDTATGFPQQYTVPPTPSGGLGTPTGVAILPKDSLWISTTCILATGCAPHNGEYPPPDVLDGLLTLRVRGRFAGHLGDWWWGLGHTAGGATQDYPAKEEEPFVTVDALTGTRSGQAYLAGTLWPLGGRKARGVIAYSPLGYKTGPWYLPGGGRVRGVAVDAQGTIYVAQGDSILKLQPGGRA